MSTLQTLAYLHIRQFRLNLILGEPANDRNQGRAFVSTSGFRFMNRRFSAIFICLAFLTLSLSWRCDAVAQGAVNSALVGTSPTYGYCPYKTCYGPMYAQRELGYLTYQPGVRGLDYGYGCGYFFGFGPPKRYRVQPPTRQTRPIEATR
jgi:hypothetical protein